MTPPSNGPMTFLDCDARMAECAEHRAEIRAAAHRWDWIRPILLGALITAALGALGWCVGNSVQTALLSARVDAQKETVTDHDARLDQINNTLARLPEQVRAVVREEMKAQREQ